MTDSHIAAAVEAAARALAGPAWDDEPEEYREIWREDARAALAAFMRAVTAEPSPSVVDAAARALRDAAARALRWHEGHYTPWDELSEYTRRCWRDEAAVTIATAAKATADQLTRADLERRA